MLGTMPPRKKKVGTKSGELELSRHTDKNNGCHLAEHCFKKMTYSPAIPNWGLASLFRVLPQAIFTAILVILNLQIRTACAVLADAAQCTDLLQRLPD
jgi:hypothetical protein